MIAMAATIIRSRTTSCFCFRTLNNLLKVLIIIKLRINRSESPRRAGQPGRAGWPGQAVLIRASQGLGAQLGSLLGVDRYR